MNKILKINGGLQELPKDPRDFQLGALFKPVKESEIPSISFSVEDRDNIGRVKDQGDSDYCTAYTITGVSEDQEGIELSPEYQFAKIKQITGKIDEWGADLRSACKSATEFGSIPQLFAQSYITRSDIDVSSRKIIADYRNWDAALDREAVLYSKDSFFSISGKNLFNELRSALWKHKDEHRSIAVGALWRQEWTESQNGIIPYRYGDEGFGHAFKIVGQNIIGKTLYLTAKLSNGKDIGDMGYFYFPEEVVNKEFVYGAFMFKDIDPEVVKEHIKDNVRLDDCAIMKFIKRIYNKIKL